MSNRFEKAINLKKIKNDNINEKDNYNLSENSFQNKITLKEKLKNIDNDKTQITINLKNKNLEKLDLLSKETKKSRAYIIDYLLENYLE